MDYVWIVEARYARKRVWDALGSAFFYTREDARKQMERLERQGVEYRIRKYIREAE